MSQKSIDKDNQILDAAAKHFAINGFGGARVDEIAAEAGVNKATLYYRIGDKAALYNRIFSDMLDKVLNKITEKVNSAESCEQKLRAYCHAIANECSQNEYISAFILREVASGGAQMSENSLHKMRQVRLILNDILQQGAEKGEFRHTNPFMVYITMVGTLNFFAAAYPTSQNSQTSQESTEIETVSLFDVAEEISNMVLNSIKMH